ncbi:MAG: hypothetical protein ACQGVC_08370 [Myxococcota bacterium]
MTLRILVGLLGVLFAVQSLGWIIDPESAAEGLGMPLLDGLGRSTQVGDFGAFFVTLSGLILLGAVQQKREWLLVAACMLLLAAVLRTLAWLVHGADLATTFVSIEIMAAVVLTVAAEKTRARQAG